MPRRRLFLPSRVNRRLRQSWAEMVTAWPYIEKLFTFLGFIIGIYSLYISRESLIIAKQTYEDQQLSGPKMQSSLDSSRFALGAMVKLADSQKKALDASTSTLEEVRKLLDSSSRQLNHASVKQLNILNQQLTISDAQRKEQLLKPKLEVLAQFSLKPSPQKFKVKVGNDTIAMTMSVSYGNTLEQKLYELNVNSQLFIQNQLVKIIYPIPIKNTVQDSSNYSNYFKLTIYVRNIGESNANKVFVKVDAPWPQNVEANAQLNKDPLLVYSQTKDQAIIPIIVNTRFIREYAKESYVVRVETFAENAPLTVTFIKFKFIN